MHRPFFFIVIAVCVGCAWLLYSGEKERFERNNPAPKNTGNAYQMIDKTLERTAVDLRRDVDMNRDGLTNCIDAAVTFYKWYPDKNNVCIMLNVNDATGMNHLFNCVRIDGVWIAIEPQAYWISHGRKYRMAAYWGNQYNRAFNKDVTLHWKQYAK